LIHDVDLLNTYQVFLEHIFVFFYDFRLCVGLLLLELILECGHFSKVFNLTIFDLFLHIIKVDAFLPMLLLVLRNFLRILNVHFLSNCYLLIAILESKLLLTLNLEQPIKFKFAEFQLFCAFCQNFGAFIKLAFLSTLQAFKLSSLLCILVFKVFIILSKRFVLLILRSLLRSLRLKLFNFLAVVDRVPVGKIIIIGKLISFFLKLIRLLLKNC
jgi:hypothetical protein